MDQKCKGKLGIGREKKTSIDLAPPLFLSLSFSLFLSFAFVSFIEFLLPSSPLPAESCLSRSRLSKRREASESGELNKREQGRGVAPRLSAGPSL